MLPALRDPSEVVPAEVHEHDVLGALLRVGEELPLVGEVFVARRAPRPRPGERDRLDGRLPGMGGDVDESLR